eukprot:g7429.t1
MEGSSQAQGARKARENAAGEGCLFLLLSHSLVARRRREQERQRQEGGARKRRQEQEKVGQSMTIKQMKAFLTAHNADLSDWTKKKTFWNAWKYVSK